MPQRPPRQRLSSNALGVSCTIDDEKPTLSVLIWTTSSQARFWMATSLPTIREPSRPATFEARWITPTTCKA
jgi:hypothetical protein